MLVKPPSLHCESPAYSATMTGYSGVGRKRTTRGRKIRQRCLGGVLDSMAIIGQSDSQVVEAVQGNHSGLLELIQHYTIANPFLFSKLASEWNYNRSFLAIRSQKAYLVLWAGEKGEDLLCSTCILCPSIETNIATFLESSTLG
eukprot:scaffold1192_cov58-Cylindrotheca_fusiformis.AAC.13